eukprot:gnl/MRDRNA2_/MRDRNA2_131416_c0_seq1.p1 gnl/MRDRNA2_/MRDRNA2_131416_c0~~gnl/MRDRNA2_/MRDRNA2_131416_c0_seq1.p1  ORF type:complete len:326 (-),score=37.40 gnl/MRDRNA2_/MRDRNA2_131416_c0_seq1:199-1176(-)
MLTRCYVSMILQLALRAQSYSNEQAVNAIVNGQSHMDTVSKELVDRLANRLVSQAHNSRGNSVVQALLPQHAKLDDTMFAKPQRPTLPLSSYDGPGTVHFTSRGTMIGKNLVDRTLPRLSHGEAKRRWLWNQRRVGSAATQTVAAPIQPVRQKAHNVLQSIQSNLGLDAFGLDYQKQGAGVPSKLLNVGVTCAPKEQGGNCTLSSSMRVTLQPSMVREVSFKLARTLASDFRLAIIVESVLEDSEAFRSGIRPNMVVEALISDFYIYEWKTDSLSDKDMQKFNDVILRAHFPMTFLMLEAVGISSGKSLQDTDKLVTLHGLMAGF